MIKDKLCNTKECVSGGRPGGVEGTRSPGWDIAGKEDGYKDEHAGKERKGGLRQIGGTED